MNCIFPAKKMGFLDKVIEELSGQTIQNPRHAVYKMVDTCAGEFAAETLIFTQLTTMKMKPNSSWRNMELIKNALLSLVQVLSASVRVLSSITLRFTVYGR